jgi:hypothetical protein
LLEVTKMEEGQTKKIRLGAGFRPPFSGFHNLDLNMVLFPWQDDSKQTSYAPDQLDFFFFEIADHINHVCSCFCYYCCLILFYSYLEVPISLPTRRLATNAWPRRAMTPETSSCQRIKGAFITPLGQRMSVEAVKYHQVSHAWNFDCIAPLRKNCT